jgi:hypothetical protein
MNGGEENTDWGQNEGPTVSDIRRAELFCLTGWMGDSGRSCHLQLAWRWVCSGFAGGLGRVEGWCRCHGVWEESRRVSIRRLVWFVQPKWNTNGQAHGHVEFISKRHLHTNAEFLCPVRRRHRARLRSPSSSSHRVDTQKQALTLLLPTFSSLRAITSSPLPLRNVPAAATPIQAVLVLACANDICLLVITLRYLSISYACQEETACVNFP